MTNEQLLTIIVSLGGLILTVSSPLLASSWSKPALSAPSFNQGFVRRRGSAQHSGTAWDGSKSAWPVSKEPSMCSGSSSSAPDAAP